MVGLQSKRRLFESTEPLGRENPVSKRGELHPSGILISTAELMSRLCETSLGVQRWNEAGSCPGAAVTLGAVMNDGHGREDERSFSDVPRLLFSCSDARPVLLQLTTVDRLLFLASSW